jgi:WD40 repeat protein
MSRVFALMLVAGCFALALLTPSSAQDDKTAPKARTDANGDPLPPAALARLGTQRFVHGPGLTSVTFGKDDRTLFSVGTTGVRTWETGTGKERASFRFPEEEQILATAVSPDARFIACSTGDGYVSIRDLQTGKSLHRFATNKGLCSNLAFGPEGRSLAWCSADGTLHVTELTGERKTRELKGAQQQARTLSFSSDGKLLAALLDTQDRAVLWDATNGKRLRQYTAGDSKKGQQQILALALDPDGKLLYAATGDGAVVAWETDSLEERYQLEATPGGLTSLTLSPDGKTLAVTLAAGGIKLFQARSGKAVQTLEGEVVTGGIAFSRDGKLLAVAGEDGRIRLWDVGTGKQKNPASGEAIASATFGKQGKEIVTAAPGLITHWSPAGKVERRVKLGDDVKGAVAVLSPCGRYALLTAVEGGESRLIDTEKAEVRSDFGGVKAEQGDLAVFHPGGRYLAVLSGMEGNVMRLYSPQTGKKLRQWKISEEMPAQMTLVFSPDGRTLFTSHALDGRLQRWEVSTGKKRQAFRFPAGLRVSEAAATMAALRAEMKAARAIKGGGVPVPPIDQSLAGNTGAGVVASPDGRIVAVLRDERVCLCDGWLSKLLRSLEGAEGALECVTFSPDGKLVAAGGSDETIRLWESATGKLVATLRGHRGSVSAVTFAPDGKTLLSCGGDGTAMLWSVAEALKLMPAQAAKQKPRAVETLWAELASEDGEAAELAGREMTAAPEAAVAWLAKHLEPARAVDRAMLNRLVEQLDSENQGLRDDATRQLIALDEQARPALEAALMKSQSAEVRKRAAHVLERIDQGTTGPDARALRAVEVLEMIGTAAAKKVLTQLSRGAAEARLTKEAAASLARLEVKSGE